MAVQRICTMEDKPYLRALWQMCFEDSDSFLEYYFEKRFCPEYTVCTIENDELVNAMYSFPVNMYIRGEIVPAAMLAGFSTDERYRGKGYMSGAFKLLINNLAKSGIAVAPHTPVNHESYFKLENYTATDTKFITGIAEKPKKIPVGVNFGRMSDVGKLYPAYMDFAVKYSGMLARSMYDFKLKIYDLISDGGEFIIADKNGETKGYALYFNSVDGLTAVEVVSDNAETTQSLVSTLAFIADSKKIRIKIPADCSAELNGCEISVIPHGVAALVNAQKLMKAVFKYEDAVIKLDDSVCEDNNGYFRLNGEKLVNAQNADIEINAGYFLQFAEGYKSLGELAEEGKAVINNLEVINMLDAKYPKVKCFICDEY
ncbi:MAG: GNAT family N-acetyltransferase [Candidatus Metalachnospira sp.]|nr:GNAT family N-acetyltransferase [Bacteroidaceae bacterium]MEA4973409.1 GNAT family N-acetyltransferase [Candidatus Metalachnospira sp.]